MIKNQIKPEREKLKLFLDRNENLDLILKKHIEYIIYNSDKNYNLYPDKLKEAYNLFEAKLGINSSEIIFTNGSEEGLRIIFDNLLSKNDTIIKWEPTFGLIDLFIKNKQANSIDLNFTLVNNIYKFNKYKQDFSPKLFYISSPNSPTGSVFDKNELIRLLDKHKKSMFILDGAYVDYDKDFYLDLYKSRNNIIIVRTFSKGWGIAGLRFGYFLSKNTKLQNCRPNYAPNNIAIDVVIDLFKSNLYILESIKRCDKNKLDLILFFKLYNIKFIKTIGNFILFESHLFDLQHLSLCIYFKLITINNINYIKISIPDKSDLFYLKNILKSSFKLTN